MRYASVTAVGGGQQPVAVNQATHTIYVTNSGDNTVSVISASACNPADPSGCTWAWPAVTVGARSLFGIAIDQAIDTIYVTNLDGATCNATITAG